MTTKPIVIVAGPTASGKSALALRLAEDFGGTIINADSMQVYEGIEIITSQPDADARERRPHRLYGVLDPADPCSTARWRDLARAEIARTEEAGRLPILVGGTGLYLRTLMSGIADLPPIADEARSKARRRHADLGGAAFRIELATLDRESAERLHASDTQRLIRAYEVAVGTGTSLSEWQRRANADGAASDLAAFTIVLDPPREGLRTTIATRLAAMVKAGAVDEVRALMARQLPDDRPAMKALGVREFAAHLAGLSSLDEAIAATAIATAQYAKRQSTWFRHQTEPDILLNAKFSESAYPELTSKVSKFLLTAKD
ncbi:MAG TPA: tRNA (adenosine(37)-N6)-dimethylallyltransferase MiaA [Alphaproteobacteria bacterium]|nr:tRNA (adenosine(37)-N6)-dimethylallyltransferase MiaA [Alphaproteobacteria bacterium]